jgi:hypothetical protein
MLSFSSFFTLKNHVFTSAEFLNHLRMVLFCTSSELCNGSDAWTTHPNPPLTPSLGQMPIGCKTFLSSTAAAAGPQQEVHDWSKEWS